MQSWREVRQQHKYSAVGTDSLFPAESPASLLGLPAPRLQRFPSETRSAVYLSPRSLSFFFF